MGFADLVVGNAGDGVLALFEGSATGPLLVSSVSTPDLAGPTALAFAGLAGDEVDFYAATAGKQAAVAVALDLGGRTISAVVDSAATVFLGSVQVNPALVTVSIGSNNLTLNSNLPTSAAVTRANSSGASSAGTSAGFSSSSALENLVTGKEGTAVLALFEGSTTALTLTSSAGIPGLSSTTALVFLGLTGSQAEFYSGNEGREAAALLALSLGVQPTSSLPSLVPLHDSSLALVGTLLPLTVDSSSSNADLGLAETEAAISLSSAHRSPWASRCLARPAVTTHRALTARHPRSANSPHPALGCPAHPAGSASCWEPTRRLSASTASTPIFPRRRMTRRQGPLQPADTASSRRRPAVAGEAGRAEHFVARPRADRGD